MIEKLGGMKPASATAGISDDQLAKWRAGRARASFPGLVAMARQAAISLDWLAFGGDASASQSQIQEPAGPGEDLAIVQSYAVQASAGAGLVPYDEGEVTGTFAFSRTWLRNFGINPDMAAIIEAKGDSMRETIHDGDPMLLNRGITDVENGRIYAIRIADELLVKRIQIKTDRSIVLISDNPAYERETLSEDRAIALHVVGRVDWVWRKL